MHIKLFYNDVKNLYEFLFFAVLLYDVTILSIFSINSKHSNVKLIKLQKKIILNEQNISKKK